MANWPTSVVGIVAVDERDLPRAGRADGHLEVALFAIVVDEHELARRVAPRLHEQADALDEIGRGGAPAARSVQVPAMHACVAVQVAAQGAASTATQVDFDGSTLGMPLTIAGTMQALPAPQRPAHEMACESTVVIDQSLAPG